MGSKRHEYNYVYNGQRSLSQEKKPDFVTAEPVREKVNMTGFFPKFGAFAVNIVKALLKWLFKAAKFIVSDLLSLAMSALKGLKWLLMELTAPFRERFNLNKGLTKKVHKARKEGEEAYKKALVEFWCAYLFGEDGVF